jgi:lysylphosphatidylglycerol synthetase-like protein (DUF2156 family)
MLPALLGADRPLGPRATAGVIAALGFGVALAGDATHVASGTTAYEGDPPELWRSAVWFPFLVSAAVLVAAWSAERAGLPAARERGRADVVTAAALVLALYALTSAIRGEPATVSVVLTGALAVAIWSWWDPSPGSLLVAVGAAVAGPLVEIAIVGVDLAHYADDADALGGVPPWLPCLYFAAGAVAARLWSAVARDGAPG